MTDPAFAAQAERHRRELHVHCYRMLASFDDAEDAVQETYLRAWRGREGFEGGPMLRAWLYRIATNVCLDMLRRSRRQPTVMNSFAEVPWLQPYPDRLLDQAAPSDDQPDAVAVERETIELVFLAALQVLPPRQRAALIARDVLGWSASQTAAALDTSVAAANSAVQRARARMQEHLPPGGRTGPPGSPAPRNGRCWRGSSTRTSAATPTRPSRSRPGTSGSPCRRTRTCSRGSTRSRRCCGGASGRTATATGGWCRRGRTGCRPPRATCGGGATASSARSSSTCCASATARSRRSRRSAPSCSRRFGLPPTLADAPVGRP